MFFFLKYYPAVFRLANLIHSQPPKFALDLYNTLNADCAEVFTGHPPRGVVIVIVNPQSRKDYMFLRIKHQTTLPLPPPPQLPYCSNASIRPRQAVLRYTLPP